MATQIPLAPIKRIIKSNTDKRVSNEAIIKLTDKLENICLQYSHDAGILAEHAGRKTITAEDIDIVLNDLASA